MVQQVKTLNPIALAREMWPDVRFYGKEREMIRSSFENKETFIVAANKMGKDFTAAAVCVLFALTRHPVRVLTTSVTDDHINTLWAEIGWLIDHSKYPLTTDRGGPLLVNHHLIRKVVNGSLCPQSYIKGRVASEQNKEAFQGQHLKSVDGIPRTMFMGDEASGLPDRYYKMARPWADSMVFFGNSHPCDNFFKRAFKGDPETKDPGGSKPRRHGRGYIRWCDRWKAEDSPNVRLGLAQIEAGKPPTNEILVPGVISYQGYEEARELWDPVMQCVGLDAEWWTGGDLYLYPEELLEAAAQFAQGIRGFQAGAIGIDPGEGGDSTSFSVAGALGLLEQESLKTPDTSVIPGHTIGLMKRFGVPPERVYLDRGGGGYQIACQLRSEGYNVNTVAFGETVAPPKRVGMVTIEQRVRESEVRYTFRNRRAQMAWLVRQRLEGSRFGIPKRFHELRRQMRLVPYNYDSEGRIVLPPKRKNPNSQSKEKSLIEIVGHSPDELDSLMLAVYGLEQPQEAREVSVMF